MVTLEQNTQNSIDSADFPSSQDHLLQESSLQQFCSKNSHYKTIFHQIHCNSKILLQINHFRTIPHKKHCFNCFLQKHNHYRTIFCKKHHFSSLSPKTAITGPFITQINAPELLLTNSFIQDHSMQKFSPCDYSPQKQLLQDHFSSKASLQDHLKHIPVPSTEYCPKQHHKWISSPKHFQPPRRSPLLPTPA